MNYKFNDDTLFHSVGFNPMKFEGILRNGLVSDYYAKEHNISFSKNFNFTVDSLKDSISDIVNDKLTENNLRNISLVRNLYVSDDELSAYNLYIKNGISFVIEDVDFIYDKSKEFLKRSDEVVVKDYIPNDKIKYIMIPSIYKDKMLCDVDMIPSNMLNYDLIKNNVINLINYLKEYNYIVDTDEISLLLKDLKVAGTSVNSLNKDSIDYKEALIDYKDIIKDIKENTYYVLNSIDDNTLTINIPIENKMGLLKNIISTDNAKKLISQITKIEPIKDINEKKLELKYKELLNTGTYEDLIKIIKTTYLRNENRLNNKKKVSEKDDTYFKLAEKYLYNELSISLNMSIEEVKNYIFKIVNKQSKNDDH